MNWVLAGLFIGVVFWFAIPGMHGKWPWLNVLKGMAVVVAGVIVPLGAFFLSAGLVPAWKGDCACGWLDGFYIGKLALSPIVLLASAALYGFEVLPRGKSTPRWIVLGMVLGAVVSSVCIAFGLSCSHHLREFTGAIGCLLYVPVWYGGRAIQLVRASRLHALDYQLAMLGSGPFWVASLFWSREVFVALPASQPTGCFVATAAGRGHCGFVGPFREVEHGGCARVANLQLIRFWRFEEWWRTRSAGSYRAFRRVYNIVGPRVAARVTSAWRADMVYVALKPFEWLAVAVQNLAADERR